MNLNQKAFGELFGVKQNTVSGWELGKSAMIREWKSLAATLSLDEDEFLKLIEESLVDKKPKRIMGDLSKRRKQHGRQDLNKLHLPTARQEHLTLPVKGRPRACADDGYIFDGKILGWAKCPPDLNGVSDAYAIYVNGNSMYPRYRSGQLVWVNPFIPIKRGDDIVIQLAASDTTEFRCGYIKEFIEYTPDEVVTWQHSPASEVRFPRNTVLSLERIVFAHT